MKQSTYILLFLSAFWHTVAFSQVTIDANPRQGCNTLSVNFSYTSTIAVATQKWFFGDNETSELSNPTHFYAKPGVYKVKLFINGTDTIFYTNSIEVSETPRIGIEYRDTITNSILVVALQATVYNESKLLFKPLQYTWAVDATPAGTSKTFDHTFDSIGNYFVGVNVSDNFGCAALATKTLNIYEKPIVPNVFTPNNDNENELFEFTLNEQIIMNFQVFTRTGLLVYKTKTAKIEWDGKRSSGEDVTSGMYYYIIETENSEPPLKLNGFFYIYR
jgi:gliding motility-associated-like protein